MGEVRRVASWTSVLRAAGADAVSIPLLRDHRTTLRSSSTGQLGAVVRGATVPESLSWSVSSLQSTLRRLSPDLVVCVTARVFHPAVSDHAGALVLDYVDRLGVSYRDRARIVSPGPRRLVLRALAAANGHFERRTPGPAVRCVAAGWQDAAALAAEWFPILAEPQPAVDPTLAHHDVLFFGNLAYPPNVDAVERLSAMWPALLRRRPGTTALIAGANPSDHIARLVSRSGWELRTDFPDVKALCSSARLAVVPLEYASGIQCKVIEAAAVALPQVLSPAALAGLRPGFPATVASTDDEFVLRITELLDDPEGSRREGLAAQRHLGGHYTAHAWSAWARSLLPAVDTAA